MNIDTGEIVSIEELRKRLGWMSPRDREVEERRWVELKKFEAEMLRNPSMSLAERIAFKVRGKLVANRAAQGGPDGG